MLALDKLKTKRVVLYGAGLVGVGIADVLKQFGVNPVCFCDKKKTGVEPNTKLLIISPKRLHDEYADATVIISTPIYAYQIEENLKNLGFREDKIISDLEYLFGDIPDDEYLKAWFKQTGYDLNLENPRTFNEKIQWLKLYDRNPQYTIMADKYEARKYIADRIGEEHLIPLLGVWDNFDDIDFDKLPNQFVLKCTHDSGSVIFCKEKNSFDKKAAKANLNSALKRNFFWGGREWAYKDIKPRIIAERYIDADTDYMEDYNLMCFNGEVKCAYIVTNVRKGIGKEAINITYYDRQWNKLSIKRGYPIHTNGIVRPANFDRMIEIAEIVSKGIPFLRVDFFEVKNQLYTGELTFYPGSGCGKYEQYAHDELLGSFITLPKRIGE